MDNSLHWVHANTVFETGNFLSISLLPELQECVLIWQINKDYTGTTSTTSMHAIITEVSLSFQLQLKQALTEC